ncbi:MAG: hypothetical protein CMI16_13680 [Opitutaceae bacterium]|nr:hypothetical protein [Opitutaceae bacterium]
MSLLDKMERRWGRYAIPNIALYFVIGQVFVLLASLLGKINVGDLVLVPGIVMQGEWWRVFTYMLVPPPPGVLGYLLIAFAFYIFYMMSSALEEAWGAFRFNLFLLLGWVLTTGLSFFILGSAVSNSFLAGSVFLAFAFLNPNFEFLLFFILPVKVKWLALITWGLYAVSFIKGPVAVRLMIMASIGNFLIFFARDIIRGTKQRKRNVKRSIQQRAERDEPRHKCVVCGKTDLTEPTMDFRYCSKCSGNKCYCSEHIRNHPHIVADNG